MSCTPEEFFYVFLHTKLTVLKIRVAFILVLGMANVFAQNSSDSTLKKVVFSAYADVYYAYDFNSPIDNVRPPFVYSFNRHNEVNLNLGFVKASYLSERVRANAALGSGTYMNANYAAEAGTLQNVYECNIGVKWSKKRNLWLDAGVFPSHIGFESAISKDCWALTRSIQADNSPYFEAGAKLTYISDSSTWLLSMLVLNGWQRIQRQNGNSLPAFGTQVSYTPSSKFTLNSSTFIGSDHPDSVRKMRYFHNLYGVFQLSKKWYLTAGFDFGLEQKWKGSRTYNTWMSPVLLVKMLVNDSWSLTGRAEWYQDKNGVIVALGSPNGFNTFGYSLNADFRINPHAVFRIECRTLHSADPIFIQNGNGKRTSTTLTTVLSISF